MEKDEARDEVPGIRIAEVKPAMKAVKAMRRSVQFLKDVGQFYEYISVTSAGNIDKKESQQTMGWVGGRGDSCPLIGPR
jgi:hypothetical protein